MSILPKNFLHKLARAAELSFMNALRLHEDAILLYNRNRIPTALLTSTLSIEELGKYYLYEDICWYNLLDGVDEASIIDQLTSSYSHLKKQRVFLRHADSPSRFFPKELSTILDSGQTEKIKQDATYVGLQRKGKRDFDYYGKINNPVRTSNNKAMGFITAFNDHIIILSVGIRKGIYGLDITAVNDYLAKNEFSDYYQKLWPNMRSSNKRFLITLNDLDDD